MPHKVEQADYKSILSRLTIPDLKPDKFVTPRLQVIIVYS